MSYHKLFSTKRRALLRTPRKRGKDYTICGKILRPESGGEEKGAIATNQACSVSPRQISRSPTHASRKWEMSTATPCCPLRYRPLVRGGIVCMAPERYRRPRRLLTADLPPHRSRMHRVFHGSWVDFGEAAIRLIGKQPLVSLTRSTSIAHMRPE